MGAQQRIRIRGARTHNLKGLEVEIPRPSLTVITGVSGSGKSSLAFDTLFQEGQRRFLEALPSFSRQFSGRLTQAEVESIEGLGPAIALSQRSSAPNPRSTVGTLSEAWDLLRLLFARLGQAPAGVKPSRSLFSFNGEEGACPRCQGLGVEDQLDLDRLVADPIRSLREGALRVSTPNGYLMYSQVTLPVLDEVLRAHGGSVDIPWAELGDEGRRVVLYGSERLKVPYGKHPLESRLKWTGITARPRPEGFYRGLVPVMEEILRGKRNDSILRFVRSGRCSACHGGRLKPEAMAVTWQGHRIVDLAALSVGELRRQVDRAAGGEPSPVFPSIHRELRSRLDLMEDLGLGYLSLDRGAPSLSRGELQRLRLLPLALGELSGLLLVLDEPSAGLHPKEVNGLVKVLQRLRDQGQTVIAVEHDAKIIRAANWLIDLGPGPGRAGGELLWSGPPGEFLARQEGPESATLRGLRDLETLRIPRTTTGRHRLKGLSRNTVRHLDLDLELGALNVLTGLSGAGKTSLLEAVAERLSHSPAPFQRLVRVDAEPIGRTPRSNAATYSGAFDLIRDRFATSPEAKARGLGRTHFSFNTPGGRCEACEGAGVIEVGMRHLGRVEVPCEACQGRRFYPDVLELRLRGLTIADLLEGSIAEAARFFEKDARLSRIFRALLEVGLGYLPLGQPATSLSGGEAQRVKLATELARATDGGALILLDEPTTGLHAADVDTLLEAWERLLDAGHTLLVADNRLSVVRRAGRVHELGPGSGPEGGRLVFSGSPALLAKTADAPTGAALRELPTPPTTPSALPMAHPIVLKGVHTHTLKGLDLSFPAQGLCGVTGPSGSGKTSLVFDTLLAEAQNRFADLVSPWARRLLARPAEARFASANGLQPTLAVAQSLGRRNPRSTVGTCSELDGLLRLLYARFGRRDCPQCGQEAAGVRCPAGHALPELWAADFCAHHERGACPECRGLGFHPRCDPNRLISHPECRLDQGALAGTRYGAYLGEAEGQFIALLRQAARSAGLDLERPWRELGEAERHLALFGSGDTVHEVAWQYRRGKVQGIHPLRGPWEGLARLVEREYERTHASPQGEELESLMTEVACAACQGEGLREAPRRVRFGGLTLPQRLKAPLDQSLEGVRSAMGAASETFRLRMEIVRRLEVLSEAGLGYLSLGREMASLSGGEAQRVRLAASLSGGLVGVTHVLDEPTRGLHARDVHRLAGVLRRLADAGNAVIVVEHDPAILTTTDHLLVLGPGSGPEGGRLVYQGNPAPWLNGQPLSIPDPLGTRAPAPKGSLRLRGANRHTLKDLDVDFPMGALVTVCGVSGSGKSSLVQGVLAPSLRNHLRGLGPVGCRSLELDSPLGEVLSLDQEPSALSSASTVLTRLGLGEGLRKRFAATPEAKAAGLTPRHFATTSPGGRCEACQGQGAITVPMDLLPDVTVECETCSGARFQPKVLACRLEGLGFRELLDSPVQQLIPRFPGQESFAMALESLNRLGLGYLSLGQAARTLSSGEQQRLELARLLASAPKVPAAILLDEPARGLGQGELPALLGALKELARQGHLLVVVEHRLDLISASDWVIDLGPEGGPQGGRIVAEGPPRQIAACQESWTGQALERRLSP